MKKGFLFFLIFLFIFPLFAQQDIPEDLYGIWEGEDRFVFIDKDQNSDKPEIVILLKMFYGYYLDFSCEPLEQRKARPRVLNDATSKDCEHVYFSVQDIARSQTEDCAWEIKLQYSKNEINYVPVAIYDNKMYLNFFVKNLIYDENNNPIVTSNGFWRGNARTEGLKICRQKDQENIPGYFVDGQNYYDIRFWKTDMEFSPDMARLNYGDKEYNVYKHIYSAGNVYSCVTGRSHTIRNVVSPFKFNEDEYYFNNTKTLMIPKAEPYLVKVADKQTYEDLVEIVKKQNCIIAPFPPPLFDDEDVDFHWDLIDELEKYNKQVQEARKRQEEFGPRPRDIIKKKKEENENK